MSRSFRSILLFAALLACLAAGCSVLATNKAFPPPSGPVDASGGQSLMSSFGEKLLVLDVRTREEFDQGHVPGAMLIPVAQLQNRLAEVPQGRPVLIVCRTGNRAKTAYDILSAARPSMKEKGLWYLDATPQYKPNGDYVFK